MRKHIVAATVTSAVLLAGGVAFAFDGPQGAPAPTVNSSSSDSSDSSSSSSTPEAPEVDAPDTESSDVATTQPDNHGAKVSEAAHTCPPGPEHGKCVSAVAHEGKDSTDAAGDQGTESDSESDDANDSAEQPSTDGSPTNDQGKGDQRKGKDG